ncbi:MAG: T9SS type A sorting domain-containing protein [Saprospiraceae bacterium]|nr:T9SS type A sorting domain-containing protein [Saprospiraceae bacterium]
MDKNVKSSTNYYRLKQLDIDGGFEYTSIIRIENNDFNAKPVSVYPNPVKDILIIENAIGSAILYNSTGQQIRQFNITSNRFEVNLDDLPTGLYNLRIAKSDGKVVTKQVVK